MTVHVLDLFSSTPAGGMEAYRFGKARAETQLERTVTIGSNRRPDSGPLPKGDASLAGHYLIPLDPADYFQEADQSLPASFYRNATMEFEVARTKQPCQVPVQSMRFVRAHPVRPD